MYNSFLLIFHYHLHLIIDLSLICNAHYAYELKMFFISHYRSSTGKDRSCDCCSHCVNQEPELGEQHRCRARSTSLPWKCSRREIASAECALTYPECMSAEWRACLTLSVQLCCHYQLKHVFPCVDMHDKLQKKLWLTILSSCIPAFGAGKMQLSLMKGLCS